jgi:microcystin degradation protein MlrC
MARIAVGGFQHETNTFSPVKATFADFEAADAWPGLTQGAAIFDAVAGINLAVAGFIHEARGLRHELVPLTWCQAQPSGHVTRDAFEGVSALLLEGLRNAGALDAIYLDLHGAMVAEHVDDADGELLRRVRELAGPRLPIVASLDFHANVSPRMAEQASALVSFRTYPHVDMHETGARAARCLHNLLETDRRTRSSRSTSWMVTPADDALSHRSPTDEALAAEPAVSRGLRPAPASMSRNAGWWSRQVTTCHRGLAAERCRLRRAAFSRATLEQAPRRLEAHTVRRPLILVDRQPGRR